MEISVEEGMEISVEERTLHFKKPARTSRGAYTEHRIFIVRIADGQSGRVGMGECAPLPDLSSDRGAYPDAATVKRLAGEALASGNPAEYLRPYPALLFALESALMGCRQDPFLFDTAFARGEEGIPANGLIWMAPFDDMQAQVESKLAMGFRCIKLKIGAIDWEDELRLLRQIRSRFPSDSLQLRVDANGGFSPEDAMSKLEQLARLDIHSIEQPILARWQHGPEAGRADGAAIASEAAASWDAMAELCRNTPIPIALDEELIGVNDTAERMALLDCIRPQYIVVKPTLHGGISGAMEWISMASGRGIGSWITSALESNIGLRNVALLAARAYGPSVDFAQGLGTGLLYTDNIDLDVELRGSSIWIRK